jgi:hypothetical protein
LFFNVEGWLETGEPPLQKQNGKGIYPFFSYNPFARFSVEVSFSTLEETAETLFRLWERRREREKREVPVIGTEDSTSRFWFAESKLLLQESPHLSLDSPSKACFRLFPYINFFRFFLRFSTTVSKLQAGFATAGARKKETRLFSMTDRNCVPLSSSLRRPHSPEVS